MYLEAPIPSKPYHTVSMTDFKYFDDLENYDITVANNHEFYANGVNVKNCMGKYHPHSDAYDSLVRFAWFSTPLIEPHGNWGELNTRAGAPRYCFAAPTRIITDKGFIKIKEIPNILNKLPQQKLPIDLKVSSILGPEKATYWLQSGKRRVFQVKTKVSNVLATSNEPFLILTKELDIVWKSLNDLKKGDLVCYHTEPHNIWPKSGAKLIHKKAEGSERQISFPTHTSKEFMTWMGWIIAEGSMRPNTIHFCNSDPKVIEDYVILCKKLFGNIEPAVHWTQPEATIGRKFQSTKPFAQVNLNSQNLAKWLQLNGIELNTSKFKRIPEIMWRASKEETISFIQSLFEGDGSNSFLYRCISYSSRSNRLLTDLQLLLMARFGLPFTKGTHYIGLSGKQFYSKFMNEIGFISNRKNTNLVTKIPPTNNISNNIYVKTFIKKWAKRHGNRWYLDENGETYNKFGVLGCAIHNPPLNLDDLNIWWSNAVKEEAKLKLPTLFNKIENIIKHNFIFLPIISIKPKKMVQTYDLTVPATNAYVANGMIVHNTECKLSQYSEKLMLSSDYLAVSPMMSNYDGNYKEPIVFPNLLPHVLLNGAEGIAVGVIVGIPAFATKGVVDIVKIGLKREIAVKDCSKHLRVKYPGAFDCNVVSTPEELTEFYKTGSGQLVLEPKYEIIKGDLIINRFTPHFKSENAIPKLLSINDVMKAENISGKKNGLQISVTLKSTVSVADRGKVYQDCIKKLQERLNLRINIIERIDEEKVRFRYCTMPDLINRWITWRKNLEVKRALYVQNKELEIIKRLELFVLACLNIDKIVPIIKSNKPDVEERLSKTLKISVEEAQIILEITLRRLTGLSLLKLQKDILHHKTILKQAKFDAKNPANAILAQVDHIAQYIKS